MQLSANERAALDAALWSAFPNPADLGQFLTTQFSRSLAQLDASRPATMGLYDYVVRVIDGEGWLPIFLRKACELRSLNQLLKNVRADLFQRIGSPTGDHQRTCVLFRRNYFVNRHVLRQAVQDLAQPGGSRILVVDGPSKSGRTFSRWYVCHYCEFIGQRNYPVELKPYLNKTAFDLVKKMASFFGWDVASIPAQHAQESQWVEEMGEWVAGRIAEEKETVWLIFDDCSTIGLPTSIKGLLVYLGEKATHVERLRMVYLAHAEDLTPSADMRALREKILSPTKTDLRTFFQDYCELKGKPLDSPSLDFITDEVWQKLPVGKEEFVLKLPAILKAAIEVYIRV